MIDDPSIEISEIWQQVLAVIKDDLSEISYQTWFSDVKLNSIIADCIVLTSSSEFNRSILEARYLECIRNAFFTVTSKHYHIEIKKVLDKPACGQPAPDVFKLKGSGLLPEYTFNNFIIGNCNRVAAKVAAKIIREPAKFNPLYIYGSVGTGKTHLLHAIGNDILVHSNLAVILFTRMDEFINEMISCIKDDRLLDFNNKYLAVDVLIIDDLQFIEGKERSQEELCRVINCLIRRGSQIILAANKPPECISYLNEAFTSQFELGAAICLEEPDINVKREILKLHAREKEITLLDNEVESLANTNYRGIRELKNSINRIVVLRELS